MVMAAYRRIRVAEPRHSRSEAGQMLVLRVVGSTFAYMRKFALTLLLTLSTASAAHAVGLSTVIRICGDDSKALCKGVSYGAPMQACLIKNKAKVTTACRKIVERLEKGEKVRVFGG
jgi:hypothetical protein